MAPERRSIIFEVVTRLIFHSMIVFSIYLLLAGHNLPGGGFAGGLTAGLALTIRYLAGGRFELREATPVSAGALLGIGLATAAASGVAPLLLGGQVFQSAIIEFWLPVFGDIKFVTSTIFDIGVYIVVVGLALDVLRSLGAEIDEHFEEQPRARHPGTVRSRPRKPATIPAETTAKGKRMSVNLTLLTVMGALYACGIYLILERSLTRVLLGLMLLANATNLLILATGGYAGLAPLFSKDTAPGDYNDPLPQALILTSIVISFAVTAFMLGIIYRTWVLARQDEIQDDAEDRRVAETPSFDAEDDAVIPVETSEFPLTMIGSDGRPVPTRPTDPTGHRAGGRPPDAGRRTPPPRNNPAPSTSHHPTRKEADQVNIASFAPLAVVLPILGAALTFLLIRHPRAQRTVSIALLSLTLLLECLLLASVWDGGTSAVNIGGWLPPWGIVMVVDQFSSLMLVVSSTVSLAVLIYATGQGMADGDRDAPVSIFHPTYLILVAGVSNAFLSGDLFNLYVGFEILLTASYVLMTLGGTGPRIRAGVTYVVVSVVSSVLFLIAIAMIYGATGTINMADLAVKLARPGPGHPEPAARACCWWRSGSRPPSSRCPSGCRTPTRRRRPRSPPCSPGC